MSVSLTAPVEPLVREFTTCRQCQSSRLDLLLDLGNHAVSDFYATPPANELRAPLRLVRCTDCGLVQLSHSVNKDRLYRNYWYKSGLNEKMVAALKDVVVEAQQWTPLYEGDRVVDIGANDGTLLDFYPLRIKTIGFEPSNLRPVSGRHVVYPTYYPPADPDYLSLNAQIITSIAMFYDVDQPKRFVENIRADLRADGTWICQMMDLAAMLDTNAFDNVCHEHTVYWAVEDFYRLCAEHDLAVVGLSRNAINGGSVRFIVQHAKRAQIPLLLSSVRTEELAAFAERVAERKHETLRLLARFRAAGKTVLGYGASTKGNTLLQYYGITTDLLPAIAERNPDKVGKVTAGQHIPIISEEEMRQRRPDYLFILPWGFTEGFLARERSLREQGTKFILPLPELQVI